MRARFWRRLIYAVLASLAAGFIVFVESTERLELGADPAPADGVLILTGGGGSRIAAGLGLVDRGAAPRALISGVHQSTSAADLAAAGGVSIALMQCCVELGRTARTTNGNGREAAEWIEREGLSRVIVVTSDFHMPRSLLILQRAAPGAQFEPYPVPRRGAEARAWWLDVHAWRRLGPEYFKLLVVLAREAASAPPKPPAAAPDASEPNP